MLTVALIAAVLSVDGSQVVATIAGPPPPAEARPEGTPSEPEGEGRRVCRYERATGSNMQQRVCRIRPPGGFQDQQTREFMRATQRVRLPDNNATHVRQGPFG